MPKHLFVVLFSAEGEKSISEFVRTEPLVNKESLIFGARFDAFMKAKQYVAAEDLFNAERRRKMQIPPGKYDALIAARLEQVWRE